MCVWMRACVGVVWNALVCGCVHLCVRVVCCGVGRNKIGVGLYDWFSVYVVCVWFAVRHCDRRGIARALAESKKINQSLSALGNVIAALTETRGRPHIPYRCVRGVGWGWGLCLGRADGRGAVTRS